MSSGRKCGRPRRSWRGGDRIAGMIRSIAIAATLGALVAGVAAYAIYPSMRPSEPTPAEQAAAAPDDWPICTMTVTMPDADRRWLGVLNAAAEAAKWQPRVMGSSLADAEVVRGRG